MGKTTLLRLIHMKRLKIPPTIDFLMVEQEIEGSDIPAIEAVLAADTKRSALMAKEQALLKELDARADDDDEDDEDSLAVGEKLLVDLEIVANDLENIDAASAEPRARAILSGLGFTVEMQERPTQKFSGGWRMRISLARALFINPTMLMLVSGQCGWWWLVVVGGGWWWLVGGWWWLVVVGCGWLGLVGCGWLVVFIGFIAFIGFIWVHWVHCHMLFRTSVLYPCLCGVPLFFSLGAILLFHPCILCVQCCFGLPLFSPFSPP